MRISRLVHFTTPMNSSRIATEESTKSASTCPQEPWSIRHLACRQEHVCNTVYFRCTSCSPGPVSLSQSASRLTNWNRCDEFIQPHTVSSSVVHTRGNGDIGFRAFTWPPVYMYRDFHHRRSWTLSQLRAPALTQVLGLPRTPPANSLDKQCINLMKATDTPRYPFGTHSHEEPLSVSTKT